MVGWHLVAFLWDCVSGRLFIWNRFLGFSALVSDVIGGCWFGLLFCWGGLLRAFDFCGVVQYSC